MIKNELKRDPSMHIPNTSISYNTGSDAVVIEYYRGIPGKHLGLLKAVQKRYGSDVRLVPLDGQIVYTADTTSGGYGILPAAGTGGRCTLGFNMIKNGEYHFVTAGHCVAQSDYWYLGHRGTKGIWTFSESDYLGYRSATILGAPDADLAVIKYSTMASDVVKYGDVYQFTSSHQDITEIGTPADNMWVCASGSTSGYEVGRRCGAITDACTGVTYSDGTYYSCMIRVPICVEPGDSGGPLWRYTTGIGVTSAGVIGCPGSGPSYFTWLDDAYYVWGLNVY